MKRKKQKKVDEEEQMKKDVEHEQMLEQVHQLELQKNYEADETYEESKD